MNEANNWIEKLKLKPHPEGGFYKESYRSDFYANAESLNSSHIGERRCSSLIYYLLKSEDFSQFHRLKSDEVWLFHQGEPLFIHIILPSGKLESRIIGLDIDKGQLLQVLIPANSWFAAKVATENSFTLVSCMVSPGFVFDDFELAQKHMLLKEFPQHKELINKLTRE